MVVQQGDRIGPYEVIAPLGQGGMATVCKAYDARLDRYVAIKMMHPIYLEDAGYHARFEREAKIVARLEHPHIVPFHEFAEHNGQPYIVMKYVEGRSLKALLRGVPVPAADVVHIMRPVAQALDYAHGQGVLHRDIKPSNILIDTGRVPYITDFGLARLTVSGASTMSHDMMIGSPQYMSPEQAQGARDLSPRSDLYALGVVLYEMLVGRVPFVADTPLTIMHDHVYRPVPIPSSINPRLTPEIEYVLMRALAKDPQDRFDSAFEMIEAIAASPAPTDEQPEAEPPSILVMSDTPPPTKPERRSSASGSTVATTTLPETPDKSPRQRRDREGWLLAGLFVVLASALAWVVFSAGLFGRDGLIRPAASATADAIARVSSPAAETARRPTSPTLPNLHAIPSLPSAEARRAVEANPADPVAHLALARALWREGQNDPAVEALNAGDAAAAADKVLYWLSGAPAALQDRRPDLAILMCDRAFDRAGDQPELRMTVRGMFGELLYRLPPNRPFPEADLRRLSAVMGQAIPGVINALVADAMVDSNRLDEAETLLAATLNTDAPAAEALLVRGDLRRAQGDNAAARRDYQAAMAIADAPAWVRAEAEAYLASLP